ncbi:MAG: Omp28 family outer membrane lipoprotein [Bacteroidia bacterium]|nr:Omp28 family outer membrane lipoprotein [Bacteroidia bacterium]
MKKLLIIVLPFIFVSACEVIEAPYFEQEYLKSLPADERCLLEADELRAQLSTTDFKKNVLVEEMTGHQCGNCPTATKEVLSLQSQYGEQLIFISVHAGPLANNRPGQPKYSTDFTTDAGDEWYSNLNDRNAVPFGMVDRTLVGTNANEWAGFVQERLASPLKSNLEIFTCYETDSSSLGVVVDVLALENLGANTRLSVVMVEDEIVDWQKDYSVPSGVSPDIPEYSHHNALRANLNGTWGEPLSQDGMGANQTLTKSYSFEMDPSWNVNNCKIIAFVYNFDSKEVYQSELKSITD